jgi:tripartite-type tricarboxylate transporter receptor subunit TctC
MPREEEAMRLFAPLFCALLLCIPPAPASAQESYPARPVRILVPYGPGGATDIIARIVAQRLTESMGQSFLVENRPGANGNLALEAAAKASPDGYTLLVGNVSTNAINENTFAAQLTIRPSRDLVGITKLVEIPHIVVASASFAPNTIAELVSAAKKDPGRINFASVGLGSYPHLDMERFSKTAGIELTHVPYKGGAGQAIPAMIGGEVQIAFFNMASLLPHIKSGRLKALAAVARPAPGRPAQCPDPRRAGLPGHRHQRVAGHVRARRHAKGDRRAAAWRGGRRAHAPGDARQPRQADDERRVLALAAGVYRGGAQGNRGLGQLPARGKDQDRVVIPAERR